MLNVSCEFEALSLQRTFAETRNPWNRETLAFNSYATAYSA